MLGYLLVKDYTLYMCSTQKRLKGQLKCNIIKVRGLMTR